MSMKMARASEKDREAVKDFLSIMEGIARFGGALIGDDDWNPDDEELGEWVRGWFAHHTGAMNRVVWGFEVLIENCCDPNADALEWRPDVAAACDAAGIK